MTRRIIILIGLSVFLFWNGLLAQEKVDAREQAKQHYLQGKEFYSQGRYQEATNEFEKALELITPPAVSPQIEQLPKERPTEKKVEEKEVGVTKAVVPEPAVETGEREYYIDIGDVLDISVWQIPDLSRSEVIVRPDGKISLPLIRDIQATGVTLTQLDEEITQRYTAYVRNPQVSVMIRRFGGNKVIILGDVVRPGVYNFTGNIRLIEALALAGDCTKFAVKNNILIIRGDIHKGPTVISSNVLAFLKYARLSENVLIQPQDIIFVPRSLIGNINAFIQDISPIIDTVYKTGTIASR